MQNRIYYFDNARGIASILGVFYHVGLIFSYPWIINISSSNFLKPTQFFIDHMNIIRMPLFLFISGYFALYSIKKNSVNTFMMKRLQRIFLPLVVGLLLIGTFQIAAINLFYHRPVGFHTIIKNLNPFNRNFSMSHLWFLYHIGVFSILILLLLKIPRKVKGSIASIFRYIVENIWITILALSITVYFSHVTVQKVWTILNLPQNALINLPRMAYNFPFFCFGAIAFIWKDRISQFIITSKMKQVLISLGVYTISLVLLKFELGYLFWIIKQIEVVSLLIFILNITARYLNYTNKTLGFISDASYAFYILHHPIILVIGMIYIYSGISSSILLIDYILLCIISIIATYSVYYLLVDKSKIGSFIITGASERNYINWISNVQLKIIITDHIRKIGKWYRGG
jgi:glucan biosynthesis protein C